MLKQTLILTALPHGMIKTAGRPTLLRIGVFITPRLRADHEQNLTLKDYQVWDDWTQTVTKISFRVRFGNANAVAASPDFSPLNERMWRTLLPAVQTRVTPFIFRPVGALYRVHKPVELSVGALHAELRQVYSAVLQETTAEAAQLPHRDDLKRVFEKLKINKLARPATPIPVVGVKKPSATTQAPPNAVGSAALVAAQDALHSDLKQSGATAPMPDFDFHERVSLLGDYPVLLPMLGLVVNLSVELPPHLPAQSTVGLVVGQKLALPTTWICPRTHYLLDVERGVFEARPLKDSEIENGFLKRAAFEVIQADAVGGMMKLQNAATNISAEVGEVIQAPNAPAEQGLPALQNAGLQVVQKNALKKLQDADARAVKFQAEVAKQEASDNAKAVVELFADDLTVGYRLDVLERDRGAWRSLHERSESYDFADPNVADFTVPKAGGSTVEGFVQPALSATRTKNDEATELKPFFSDVLCAWDGWSLSAPKPGANLAQPHDFKPAQTTQPAPADLRFKVTHQVKPGSLPRLRFGRPYVLRVRTVDLAGYSRLQPNDTAFNETAPNVMSETVVYRRFQPVPPPAVMYKSRQVAPAPPRVPVEGESLERMVVRSDLASSRRDPQAVILSERFFAPPKAAQTTAELHEKLDGLDPQSAYELSVREYATLIYTHQAVLNPSVQHVEFEETPGKKRMYKLCDGVRRVERKDTQGVTQEIYYVQDKDFAVAYLPDPLARGVFFRGLPDVAEAERINGLNVNVFEGDYPNLAAFRLRLRAGALGEPSESRIEEASPTVVLAPGATVEIKYSSFGDGGDVAKLGLAEWAVNDKLSADAVAAMLAAGAHPALTPYRKITLVHAVKQPLKIPSFVGGAINPKKRALGGTSVLLEGQVTVHGASTEKVDVSAEFNDLVDAGTGKGELDPATQKHTGLTRQTRRMFVGTIHNQLKAEGAQTLSLSGLPHEIGDTKAHQATYSLEATTAFREYFQPDTRPEQFVRPTAAERESEKEKVWQATCVIKSTARPAAPKVLYAVPTFNWREETRQNARQRTREGHGLRVYLERPWHTSGYGEMLAVVLAPPAEITKITDSLLPLVSQCGADPVHEQPDVKDNAFLQPGDFAAPVKALGPLKLAEQPEKTVDAAAFEVHFDADRELWYADVTFKPKFDYFPFVSLALACYQPNSELEVELSNVVRLDPVQIVPHRTATVFGAGVRGGASSQTSTVSVSVSGKTWEATAKLGLSPNVFQAIVERLNPDLGADFGWQPVQTIKLDVAKVAEGVTTWSGNVKLEPTSAPLRLRVVEYELYNNATGVTDAKPALRLDDLLADIPGARLVYTDVFPLD